MTAFFINVCGGCVEGKTRKRGGEETTAPLRGGAQDDTQAAEVDGRGHFSGKLLHSDLSSFDLDLDALAALLPKGPLHCLYFLRCTGSTPEVSCYVIAFAVSSDCQSEWSVFVFQINVHTHRQCSVLYCVTFQLIGRFATFFLLKLEHCQRKAKEAQQRVFQKLHL